jgi:lysophospholipid acyltransferase (LPLAT)-like uncharacterized protein
MEAVRQVVAEQAIAAAMNTEAEAAVLARWHGRVFLLTLFLPH